MIDTEGERSAPVRHGRPTLALQLLGGFELRIGDTPQVLSPACQRLIALMAVRGCPQTRAGLAGALWCGSDEQRAAANLRGVIWRLPGGIREHLVSSGTGVALDGCWSVDVEHARGQARRLRAGAGHTALNHEAFQLDLLPGWYDSWLVDEQERYRQLRLNVLEQLAGRYLEAGDAATAADLALASVLAEPLRESAQLLLISAHLRQGNRGVAKRQFARFRETLLRELGVEPSPQLAALLGEVAGPQRTGEMTPG